MGRHGQTDVVEELDDFVRIAEIRRLARAQQQELVEHVKYLRRRLMDRDDDCLSFRYGVSLYRSH